MFLRYILPLIALLAMVLADGFDGRIAAEEARFFAAEDALAKAQDDQSSEETELLPPAPQKHSSSGGSKTHPPSHPPGFRPPKEVLDLLKQEASRVGLTFRQGRVRMFGFSRRKAATLRDPNVPERQ